MQALILLKRSLTVVCVACLGLTACSGGGGGGLANSRPVLDATYRASGHAAAGDVFVHLFEWPWPGKSVV